MKRLFLLIAICLLFFTGCNFNVLTTRKIRIIIPQHPWEDSNIRLWYTLKWNSNGKIESLYIDNSTREVDISIPKNCTVFVCAYPLGDMLPFGNAVTPTDSKAELILSQNDGYLAHLLINSDLEATEHVNFSELINVVESATYDFRMVDDSTLIADVMNGRLTEESIEIREKVDVPQISIPSGNWICEWEADGTMFVENNKTKTQKLPAGVLRFYCKDLDREFRVVVEYNGSVFHSLRYGMIGL